MSKNYSIFFSHTWFAYHNTFDTIFFHMLSWQQQNQIRKCFDFEQSLISFGQFLAWESCRSNQKTFNITHISRFALIVPHGLFIKNLNHNWVQSQKHDPLSL